MVFSSAGCERIELLLRPFNAIEMERRRMCLFYGETGTGKTAMMESLSYELNFQQGVAFCGSPGSKSFFKEFMPASYVRDATADTIQDMLWTKGEKLEAGELKLGSKNSETIVFIDDISYERKFMYSSPMVLITSNNRHYDQCVFLSAQFRTQVSPATRANGKYIFWTADESPDRRKKYFDDYGGVFESTYGKSKGREVWDTVFTAATQNFGALVMDKTIANANTPSDRFFWYKATFPMPKWRLGGEAFQQYDAYRTSKLTGRKLSAATTVSDTTATSKISTSKKGSTSLSKKKKPVRASPNDDDDDDDDDEEIDSSIVRRTSSGKRLKARGDKKQKMVISKTTKTKAKTKKKTEQAEIDENDTQAELSEDDRRKARSRSRVADDEDEEEDVSDVRIKPKRKSTSVSKKKSAKAVKGTKPVVSATTKMRQTDVVKSLKKIKPSSSSSLRSKTETAVSKKSTNKPKTIKGTSVKGASSDDTRKNKVALKVVKKQKSVTTKATSGSRTSVGKVGSRKEKTR